MIPQLPTVPKTIKPVIRYTTPRPRGEIIPAKAVRMVVDLSSTQMNRNAKSNMYAEMTRMEKLAVFLSKSIPRWNE